MIVVNFASGHFINGQKRLATSLNGHCRFLGFSDYGQLGSPKHSESPYQFKIHAIEKAFEEDDIVLWADASLWRVGDLSIIENLIKTDGFFFSEAGHWVGSWTNQFTRDYFKLTEEEAKVPGGFFMFSAGLTGLNKQSTLAMDFFQQWKDSALAGCFRGSYNDHRHDMTCGSIIAQRLGMTYQRGGKHMSYLGPGYAQPEKETVFYLQGV
jgi:hypothetical protein